MKFRPLPAVAGIAFFWCLACGGLDPGPLDPGTPVADTVPRFNDLLEPIREKHDLPAVGAAVFDSSGQLLGIGAVGQRGVGVDGAPSEAVTVEDRWHLGSDTKAMTATLAALVVEQSTLSFDTPVTALLPDADPTWQAVTLRHLLSHTGGVRDEIGDLRRLYIMARHGFDDAPAGRASWVEAMVSAPPHDAPGDYHYSNEGYILAGHLLELQQGQSWEQLMTDRLFAPLKMEHTGFGPPTGPHPWGHVDNSGALAAVLPSLVADNPGALGPAGTVHATLADWARFGALHLAAARDSPRLLSGESFSALHEKQSDYYALGWIVAEDEDFGGASVLTHDGSNSYWYARVMLVPAHDRGYLFVTNASRSGNDAADDAIAALAVAYPAATQPEAAAEPEAADASEAAPQTD
ncbi:MAG TPA: hypothetical protein DFR83_09360 [Deltaproteobacteria bacterium]|nr:hypothetical protein [Deltaproteobacteria bacterium]